MTAIKDASTASHDISDEAFTAKIGHAKSEGMTGIDIGVSNDSFDNWAAGKQLPHQATRRTVMRDLGMVKLD